MDFQIHADSLGEVRVPKDALYRAQTQRAIDNFPVSGIPMPSTFLTALALIKQAAATSNVRLGLIDDALGRAIQKSASEVARGSHHDQFPVDVFQTGSGTSTNMNMNEVLATLASRASGLAVHPNDHVNASQSSNDVIPSAINLSAAMDLTGSLLPACEHLTATIKNKMAEVGETSKTGRTHLMDAMPVTFAQELSGWAAQIRNGASRIEGVLPRLHQLALGGTAVGTGINAHPDYATLAIEELSKLSSQPLTQSENLFEALSSQDTAVELSGQLKVLAVALMKIANDLRWMNSGPLAGIAEIELTALQPGSSIMPGKVNPVAAEAVTMVAAQVIGNDAAITVAGQSGNFQLNVMLPVIAFNLLQSIHILASAARLLADSAIRGFKLQLDRVDAALARNPILVTALNRRIGYEKAAAIAKRAYAEKKDIVAVAAEMTDLTVEELSVLLNPTSLTRGGLQGD